MRKNTHFSGKGTAIIEMVIYTFLLFTLLIVITDVFATLFDTQKESVSYSESQTDARFISQKLINTLSTAGNVLIPVNPGDNSNILTIQSGTDTYTFFLSGGNLISDDGVTQERLNSFSTNISNFNIIRLQNPGDKPLLRITADVTSTIQRAAGPETEKINLTAGIR